MNSASKRVLRSLVPVICPPEAAPLADAIVEHMALTLGARARCSGVRRRPARLRSRRGRSLWSARALRLTGDRAERYYQYWESSQFGRAINQIMSLACYEQPEMMKAVGFEPERGSPKSRRSG